MIAGRRSPLPLLACVAWGATWLYASMVAWVEITSCTQGSTDSWLVSLLIGLPLAAAALAVLGVARHQAGRTRWLALPHAVLLPAAALVVVRYLSLATVHGEPLCAVATGEPAFAAVPGQWWNGWWAPLQGAGLIAVAAMVYLYWHRARADDRRNATRPA